MAVTSGEQKAEVENLDRAMPRGQACALGADPDVGGL